MDSRRVQFALGQLKGRLHESVGDKRCGCGQCAYWVARAARGAGISRATLEAELKPRATAERHRPRRPQPLRAQICESGTIRPRGADGDPRSGLAILLTRLRDVE